MPYLRLCKGTCHHYRGLARVSTSPHLKPYTGFDTIVGTEGHFLIRLGSQNERDGQRDTGAPKMGRWFREYEVASSKGVMHGVYLWSNGGTWDGGSVFNKIGPHANLKKRPR